MHRSRLAFVAAILFLPALSRAAEMLSPVDAQRLGLVESWHRQLAVARGADSLVDIRLWVQKTKDVEYLEIVRAGQDGKPLPDAPFSGASVCKPKMRWAKRLKPRKQQGLLIWTS